MKLYNILLPLCVTISCSAELREKPSAPEFPIQDPNAVIVNLKANEKISEVSDNLIGFNMNFDDDENQIWDDGKLAELLGKINTRVLRYPGGGKTGLYHWQDYDFPKYKDPWNHNHLDKVSPEDRNKGNMDVDEFFGWCEKIGAMPLLGINLQSGEKLGLREKSIQDAIDLIKHVQEKGYRLMYVYLDSEVDNANIYYQMTVDQYAELIKLYGTAIRKVNPNIKFIANLGGSNNLMQDKWKNLISMADGYIDVVDIHIYYDWGKVSWDKWLKETPMQLSTGGFTFDSMVRTFKKWLNNNGKSGVEVACLEWNIAPPNNKISGYKQALMQGEMFGQFLNAGLSMASIWPLLYKGIAQGAFPTIVEQDNPEQTTPTYEVFKFYSPVLGKTAVANNVHRKDMVVYTYAGDEETYFYLINKSSRDIVTQCQVTGDGKYKKATIETLSSVDFNDVTKSTVHKTTADARTNGSLITIPQYSMTKVVFSK